MATTPRHSRCCRRPLRASKLHRKTEATTSEAQQCVICLDTISSRGKLGVCDHAFCYACIFEWSKNSNTCPLCKQRFRCITKVSLVAGGTPDRQVFVSDKDQREWYEEDFVDSEGFPTADIFERLDEYDLEDSFIDDSDDSYGLEDTTTHQAANVMEYTPPSPQPSNYQLRTRHAVPEIRVSSRYELRNRPPLVTSTNSTSGMRTRQQERRALRARRALSSLSNTPSDISTSQERRPRRTRQALSPPLITPSPDSSSVETQQHERVSLSSSDMYSLQDQTTSPAFEEQTTSPPASEEQTSSGFSSFSSESSIFADYEAEDEFHLNCNRSHRKHKLLKFDSDTDDDDEDFITVHHATTRRGMRQAILLTSDESETELEQDYITCNEMPASSLLVRRELYSPRYSQSSMPQYLTSTRRRQLSPDSSKPSVSDSDITQFTSDEEENFTTQPVTSRRGVATTSHTHKLRYPQVSIATSTAGVWLTARDKRAEHQATRRGQKRKRRDRIIYQSRHHDNSSDGSDWNPFEI